MHAFRSILIVVTQQQTSDLELHQAFRLALDNRSTVLIALFDNSIEIMRRLHFVPLEKKLELLFRQQLEEELTRLKELAWEHGVIAKTMLVYGKPCQHIHEVISDNHIDIVVKLVESTGALTHNQLSNTDLTLLKNCPVPILMMANREQLPNATGKILVAIDVAGMNSNSNDINSTLLKYGIYLSCQEEAELHLACVWNMVITKKTMKRLTDEELYELQDTTQKRLLYKLNEIMKREGVSDRDVYIHLLRGNLTAEIQNLANNINVDLIIMNSLSSDSEESKYSYTTGNVINGVYCSILAVKPERIQKLTAKCTDQPILDTLS